MIRKNIGFRERNETPFGIDYLEMAMARFDVRKPSVAVEMLFKEHAAMKQQLEEDENLVEAIYQRFKKDLDVIRVRSGFSDKNVRILLELWNGFLIENNQEKYLTTKDFLATPLKTATDKVSDEIAGFRQRNLESKKRKALINNE